MPIVEIAPLRDADQDVALARVLDHLGANEPGDVQLSPAARCQTSISLYRASHGTMWAYVDRVLAVGLRERGARWFGEVHLDPCPVA
jgi:hypothetical protein